MSRPPAVMRRTRLSLLINGAFVSPQIFRSGEATSLLRHTAHALIETSRR